MTFGNCILIYLRGVRRLFLVPVALAIAAVGALVEAPAHADGIAGPSPYGWVSPPANQSSSNQPPSSGMASVSFHVGVSDPATVFTDDGQVTLSLPSGASKPQAGQTAVQIRITPVRPQPRAPSDFVADGNAYLIQASPIPSGAPVMTLERPALVDLRYPFGYRPDAIYLIEGPTWTPIGGTVQTLLLTVDARTLQLGTFIAGRPATTPTAPASGPPGFILPVAFAIVVFGILLLIAGVGFRRGAERLHGER